MFRKVQTKNVSLIGEKLSLPQNSDLFPSRKRFSSNKDDLVEAEATPVSTTGLVSVSSGYNFSLKKGEILKEKDIRKSLSDV